MTVVDQLNVVAGLQGHNPIWQPLTQRGEPNASVVWEIDVARWKNLLYELLV